MPVAEHTEHHTLTLEWAKYPEGPGEVTAAFCTCEEGDTVNWADKLDEAGGTAKAQVEYVAALFAMHLAEVQRR